MPKVFISKIQSYFEEANHSIHKARNELKIIEHEGKKFVVKSFKVPHLLNRIIYSFFRKSKAQKSYENSIKISGFVPKAIAYKIYKSQGLIAQSYFISEYFAYDFTIREPLLDNNFEEREDIFRHFALFTYLLHEEGICHLDYSPGNILIQKTAKGYCFKIVDINRMKFKNLKTKERLQNFAKLWAKDEDLEIMISSYAKLIDQEEVSCVALALAYSQKHKDKKNFKKRLKGEKVVD